MKRRIAAYAAALSLAVSGLIGIGSPAMAAPPTCYELNCNNLDLSSTNCTTNAFAIDGFVLQDDAKNTEQTGDLWFSPSCHAFWGEYDQKVDGGVDIALWGIPEYGGMGYISALNRYLNFYGPGHWTTKLYSSRRSIKFCWTQAGQGGDAGDSGQGLGQCTKWR